MRIVFVTPHFFPQIGGVETHVAEVASRLANMGASVGVLTTNAGNSPPIEEWKGFTIYRVKTRLTEQQYALAPDIYTQLRRGKWDLVHCQSYHTFAAPLGMLGARRSGIPYVVTFHGGGHSSRWRNRFRRTQLRMLQPLLAGAAKLVAVAAFEVAYYSDLLHLSASRFVLIPNGCDLLPHGAPSHSEARGTVITSVGRLERYKGHHRVIGALPKVIERKPDVSLRIVGTGPYEATLRRLARRLGVSDRVTIGGIRASDRHAMSNALRESSLVTLLSDFETHPISVLEAASVGCRTLVTRTSGLMELEDRGLARGLPLESTSDQVAEAIVDQLNAPPPPPRRDLPTWDDCAAGLMRLYSSVLSATP